MRSPARLLIADDIPDNLEILRMRLGAQGYDITTVSDGRQALSVATSERPDLVLLDIMMPEMDGVEVCRRLKSDPDLPFMPIIMLTARASTQDVITALEAGADEYLTKPVDHGALVARVRSMLRIKSLNDTVSVQAKELAAWNETLERRVNEQIGQLERLSQLKRFFSPRLAEAILAGGAGDPLVSHRREIVVVFLDLRGFTAFAETSEPEEVMGVLGEFHGEIGRIIARYDATLERFTGDGMMVFFNDPVVVADAAHRALRMAVEMRGCVHELSVRWRKQGHDLTLGMGIAKGFATIGAIGFEGRIDYGAIGAVTNLAARLCAEAKGGEILVAGKALADCDGLVDADEIGVVPLKGFAKQVTVFRVNGLTA